jgi:hypothetical protein
MSTEPNSIENNVEQGRGIVDKEAFRVVGMNKKDLDTGGHDADDKRGRGRPSIDKTWSEVGRTAEKEQGRRK